MGMRRQPDGCLGIRVLVSDDTRVHTELLADALKRERDLRVTSLPSGSADLLARADFCDTDVLLISSNLDARPGQGFEVLRDLRALHRDLKAVVILDTTEGPTILEAFKAGARGIFSKNDSFETLGKCLRKVNEGQIWANGEQISILVDALACGHDIRAVDAKGLNLLSNREMQVVRGVAQGFSNREIAERLQLSQHTVKNFLFRIFDKLGVSSRVELLFMTLSQERHSVLSKGISQRNQELPKNSTTDQGFEAEQLAKETVRKNRPAATKRELQDATTSLRPRGAGLGLVS